jgi:hypothetical protein
MKNKPVKFTWVVVIPANEELLATEITAETCEIKDKCLIFFVHTTVVYAFAPGRWLQVHLKPEIK